MCIRDRWTNRDSSLKSPGMLNRTANVFESNRIPILLVASWISRTLSRIPRFLESRFKSNSVSDFKGFAYHWKFLPFSSRLVEFSVDDWNRAVEDFTNSIINGIFLCRAKITAVYRVTCISICGQCRIGLYSFSVINCCSTEMRGVLLYLLDKLYNKCLLCFH